MLDVRRMRVLREVAVRGSFSAAADALSFTQSAVSQQIAALEREAGTTLVQRSARGVRLTQAGEAVVRHTDAIMARLAEAEAELEAIAGLRGGRLRMASFESAGATLMPLAIARFRAQHPAVELSMSLSEPEDCIPQLRSGELDLAIVFESAVHKVDDGIDRMHLIEDPMYLILPRDHPLANKRGGRLRAADRLRDRRLHGDAGLRGRRRRRLADGRARAHQRARRHRRARPRARDAGAADLRRHARGRLPLAGHAGDAGDPARRRGGLRVA